MPNNLVNKNPSNYNEVKPKNVPNQKKITNHYTSVIEMYLSNPEKNGQCTWDDNIRIIPEL